MDIWHVESKNGSTLRLWRTGNVSFRVIQNGKYEPLLTNGTYTLIHRKYSEVFEALEDQALSYNVAIVDKEFNTETFDYIELNINDTLEPSTIETKDSKGLRIWICGGNVFVSGDLKRELIKISESDFNFNLGFSHFA